MADDFTPDIPESDGPKTKIRLKALRMTVAIDEDIWQRQKNLGRVTDEDEFILRSERFRTPWSTLCFGAGAVAPVIWGRIFARPYWSRGFVFAMTVFTSTSGLLAGQVLEAVGDWRVLKECSNPQALMVAYQESARMQLERNARKLRGQLQPEREAAVMKKRDEEVARRRAEIVRRHGLEPGSVPSTGSAGGDRWDGSGPSEGMVRGPVTQELERQPNAWRSAEGTETLPRPPRPSPRSAAPQTSPIPPQSPPPASETEEPQESAWEALRRGRLPARKQRQQDQRSDPTPRVPDSETGDTPSYDTPIGLDDFEEPVSADEAERRRAQQVFDEMLEKERQFGQGGNERRRSGKEGTW